MNIVKRYFVSTAAIALVSGFSGGTATAEVDVGGRDAVAFTATALDSDVAGRATDTDPNLLNAWGLAFAPGGPFWINDNASGLSTLYRGDGSIVPLVVAIPGPAAAPSSFVAAPTGMIWNPTAGFLVPGSTVPAAFIFDTEDGTVSAWNFTVNPNRAVLAVDNSASGAVYKGLAFGSGLAGNRLYATNFRAGTVDVFDTHFAPSATSGKFADPRIPPGFAPFGIQNIDGDLWITYAKQDAAKHDDVGGPGSGFVDVFDTDGNLLRRFAARGVLDSPWGLARAPYGFGQFSGDILIGNFKDGRIHAFDAQGHLSGTLRQPDGSVLSVAGLWALAFGGAAKSSPEQLFYTAGPDGETNGVFGVINARDKD